MKHNKTQKGNPYQLTVNQHTFPKASIDRFCNTNGCVDTYLINDKKRKQLNPKNWRFCAKKGWDQKSEKGYLEDIENPYGNFAQSILSGEITLLNQDNQKIISDMFALWSVRSYYKLNPIQDTKIEGIIGVENHITQDSQEDLENRGISTITPDGYMRGPQIAGAMIRIKLSELQQKLSEPLWGIVRAREGEFIVPDRFVSHPILPLSPSICFFYNCVDKVISQGEVDEINRMALKDSRNYFFGRDLGRYI